MGKNMEKRGHENKPPTTSNLAKLAPRRDSYMTRGIPNNTGKKTFLMLSCAVPLTGQDQVLTCRKTSSASTDIYLRKGSEGSKNKLYLTLIRLTCSSISFARSSCSSIFKIACLISSLDSFNLSKVST